MANIQRCIEVTVMRETTGPATKRFFMPLSPLDMPTSGTGGAGLSALKRRVETVLGSPMQTPLALAQDWRLKEIVRYSLESI